MKLKGNHKHDALTLLFSFPPGTQTFMTKLLWRNVLVVSCLGTLKVFESSWNFCRTSCLNVAQHVAGRFKLFLYSSKCSTCSWDFPAQQHWSYPSKSCWWSTFLKPSEIQNMSSAQIRFSFCLVWKLGRILLTDTQRKPQEQRNQTGLKIQSLFPSSLLYFPPTASLFFHKAFLTSDMKKRCSWSFLSTEMRIYFCIRW